MNLKIEAARAALQEVRSGMSLGLGTGSTATEFVKLLGEALRSGQLRDIRSTCTSEQTEALARENRSRRFLWRRSCRSISPSTALMKSTRSCV